MTFEFESELEKYRGNGCRLTTPSGEYIDIASGTFNLPLGYADEDVVNSLISQIKRCSHLSSSFTKRAGNSLVKILAKQAPENIESGWVRDITGSTANECAIKIAQKKSGKDSVISLFLSHHGQTNSMTAISGNSFRREGFPLSDSPFSLKVPPPYCHRCPYNASYPGCGMLCVEKINDFIEYASNGSIACMIIEPILGNGGNIVPPKAYFEHLSKLCEEQKIILIADEVQTGVGRTGYFLASEAFEFKPNIITLAKGLGGIGIPSAAVLMESRLDVLQSHEHSFTSGANTLALTAALVTVEKISKPEFLSEVRRKGDFLGKKLNELGEKYSCISDVRGMGFTWGLEISDSDGQPDVSLCNQIIKAAYSTQKMIVRGSRYGRGNVVKVRPPLITEDRDLEEIIVRLDKAISLCTK
jgi:4-aminobutyrate aminotransferase-like enzyme